MHRQRVSCHEESQQHATCTPLTIERHAERPRGNLHTMIGALDACVCTSPPQAQRIKLSRELARRSTGKTLYILDEPSTGLHFEDVRKLLLVIQRLTEGGNTVVMIEHNLDIVKTADWILDIGPEGGSAGGRLVAEGPPEDLRLMGESATAEHLSVLMNAASERPSPEKT